MAVPELPIVGFHFRVDFILTKKSKSLEGRFQSIEGIGKELEFEKKMEGENTVEIKSPLRIKEGKLKLRRGLIVPKSKAKLEKSGFFDLLEWFEENIKEKRRIPIPLVVTALNADHDPEQSWFFYNTYPIAWTTSGFDAMKGDSVVMEEITLEYDTYKQVDTSGMKTKNLYKKAKTELGL